MEPSTGREILEHTADLGVRAWGRSLEEAFEQAAWALVDLLDVRAEGPGETRGLVLSAPDAGGLLVDLLNEIVFLVETSEVGIAGIEVRRVAQAELEVVVAVAPLARRPEGVVVKAATYHGLAVERTENRAEVRVFLDV